MQPQRSAWLGLGLGVARLGQTIAGPAPPTQAGALAAPPPEAFYDAAVFIQVYFIHVHPGYNYTNYRNDIAVLVLSSPATITSAVRPVCLWDKDKTDLANVEGKFGTVSRCRVATAGPPTARPADITSPPGRSLQPAAPPKSQSATPQDA